MSLLALDSRWRRFNDETRACPCCGRRFNGVFDIGFDQPDDWPHGPRMDETDVIVGEDRLSGDLCRHEGRHFVRAVLALPLRGSDEVFHFGPWVEVPETVFTAYLATFDPNPPAFVPTDGILANSLPQFEDASGDVVTLSLPDPTQRPQVLVETGDLAKAQSEGISFDDLLDIYAGSDMDIRPHLAAD